MRITILAIGSEGDVRYLLALGKGLLAAGHSLCVATHAVFEKRTRDLGLEFAPIQANPREMLESNVGQATMEKGNYWDFARFIQPAMLQVGCDCWAACQGADVVVYSPLGWYCAPDICEKLGVPGIAAFYLPLNPTQSFPSLFVTQRQLGGMFNRLTYLVSAAVLWWPHRPAVNQWRREQLNLPPHGFNWGHEYYKQRMPILYAFSSQVVPKPPDWGEHVTVTGYWFLEEAADWQPPPKLLDFLAAGSPPVYIGFGSMSNRRPEEMTDLVLQALARAHQRAVLATGWGGLSQSDLPDEAFKIDWAPHDWLFPRMAAAVHHGGAGTTAAVLRAGIPCVVVPHFMDQPFWGQQVADLGVGPQPIPRKQLTVDRLAAAITTAVSDRPMRQRTAALGARIRGEDGVARAVEVLEQCLSTT